MPRVIINQSSTLTENSNHVGDSRQNPGEREREKKNKETQKREERRRKGKGKENRKKDTTAILG